MAWEVFGGAKLQADRNAVSISSMGRLYLTKSASNGLTERHIRMVELLFNRETNEVALRGVNDSATGNYDLKLGTTGKRGAGFSCISFLNHIGYDWLESRSFDAKWTEKGWLTFKIPKEMLGHPPLKRRRITKAN